MSARISGRFDPARIAQTEDLVCRLYRSGLTLAVIGQRAEVTTHQVSAIIKRVRMRGGEVCPRRAGEPR